MPVLSPPTSSPASDSSPDVSPSLSSASTCAATATTPLISASDPVTSSIAVAVALKAAGGSLLQSGDVDRAIAKYSKIFAYVNGLRLSESSAAGAMVAMTGRSVGSSVNESQQAMIDDLILSTNSNLALCYHKVGQPDKVIAFASKALQAQPQHVKSLFRRGAAYRSIGALDLARIDLTAAVALCPADAAIRTELRRLRADEAKQEEGVRKQFAGMFR
jgi:tetratricopeptide (TPR) repeat protein